MKALASLGRLSGLSEDELLGCGFGADRGF